MVKRWYKRISSYQRRMFADLYVYFRKSAAEPRHLVLMGRKSWREAEQSTCSSAATGRNQLTSPSQDAILRI